VAATARCTSDRSGLVVSGAGGLLLEVATETTYPVELSTTLEVLRGFKSGEKLRRGSSPLVLVVLWSKS